MSSQISSSAQSARENAREHDGRFGEQEHARADGVDLGVPDVDAVAVEADRISGGSIGRLPFRISDVQPGMRNDWEPERSFDEAFAEYFADAAEILDGAGIEQAREDHDELAESAGKKVARAFGADSRVRFDVPESADRSFWLAESERESGAKLTLFEPDLDDYLDGTGEYEKGPTLRKPRAKVARQQIDAVAASADRLERARLLQQIRDGEKMPWAFLPGSLQQEEDADEARSDVSRSLDSLERTRRFMEKAERALPYQGMDDEQIKASYRAEYGKTVPPTNRYQYGSILVEEDVWVQKEGIGADGALDRDVKDYVMCLTDDELDGYARNRLSVVQDGRRQIDHLGGPDQVDLAKVDAQITEAEGFLAYFEASVGYPSGDSMPEKHEDGSWTERPPIEMYREPGDRSVPVETSPGGVQDDPRFGIGAQFFPDAR